MMKRRKLDREALKQRALEIMREEGRLVTTDFIATKLGIKWYQARVILFELVAEGKVRKVESTMSPLFTLAQAESIEGVS